MSADGNVFCYVGFNAAGKARAFVRDDPKFRADTAKTVAEWIKEGRTVRRMPWDEMYAAMKDAVL